MRIKHFSVLPYGDPELKACLNYNPTLSAYTKKQPETGRDPSETDRGGWRGYDRVYSHYISYLKDEPIKLLEIGAHAGFGLLAWAKYFKKGLIEGTEIEHNWKQSNSKIWVKYKEATRINFNYFDSRKKTIWNEQYFDVIIDDASHKPLDQIAIFKNNWPSLKQGGYYFIEDISCRYVSPTKEIVFDMLLELMIQKHQVSIYSHKNEGWESHLKNPKVWKHHNITEKTPTIAEDYIAVIRKK